jgi:hypothetical protein
VTIYNPRDAQEKVSELEKRTGNVPRLAQITEVEAENMYVVMELILDHLTMRSHEHSMIDAQLDLMMQKINKIEAVVMGRSGNDNGRNGTGTREV